MRIPAIPRRRSSVVYSPAGQLHGTAGGAYAGVPLEAAGEGPDSGVGPAPMDLGDGARQDNMTPSQIEHMINQLQVCRDGEWWRGKWLGVAREARCWVPCLPRARAAQSC
jgi:hypothetical protein